MKYFIDTEFIEGFRKPLFGKRRHSIDLISIGIVAEDGRSYYAVSKEFNPNRANQWVRENVLPQLPNKRDPAWKSLAEIADDINYFVNPHLRRRGNYHEDKLNNPNFKKAHGIKCYNPDRIVPYYIWRSQPEFYGYYSDYDWVVFCSLFGTMMDLPTGFPKYCKDLKQCCDDYLNLLVKQKQFANFEQGLVWLKNLDNFPVQENAHNALADAFWNRDLYLLLEGFEEVE